MSRIPYPILVLVLGAGLLLPLLGAFGLWDPIEIQYADMAQEVAQTGNFRDVTVGGRFAPQPVLYVWLVALGFKVLGVTELAGRLPLALLGIVTLLLAYRVGRKLVSPKVGLLAAFVLGTTPTFLFQSRQLVSNLPLYISLLAAVGGLAAILWPADGRRQRRDVVIALLGLVGGFLSGGLVLGVAFPLFAFALAVALGWRTRNSAVPDTPWLAAVGPDLPATATIGSALRASARPLAVAILGAAVLIGALLAVLKPSTYLFLGGAFRKVEVPAPTETFFRDVGFGFFPWFALLPIALLRFLLAQRSDAEERPRVAFPLLVMLIVAAAAYVLGTFWQGYLGAIRYPALPWLALAVAVLLVEVLEAPEHVHRAWAVVAAGFVLALHADFYMEPQSLAFSHLLTAAKYPTELNLKLAMRVFGLLLALLFFLGLGGAPGRIAYQDLGVRFSGRKVRIIVGGPLRFLGGILDAIGGGIRALGGPAGRRYLYAALAVALVFAGWCSFYLTPQLSLHLSNKALFETYHRCAVGAERLGQYQVAGRGAAYYNKGQVDEVRDQNQLFALLRQPQRVFVIVPSSYLAQIDQAARQASVTYHVLDDRNSQYLVVSNRLAGSCTQDLNPLRRYVLSKPPKVRKPVNANFENKVKLIGYDVDDTVTRGGKFKFTLYFQVLARLPPNYKLFLHFDQPAHRFHGDHDPLDGKFPTQYWLPGDYIVDPHEIDLPLITTPSGDYTVFAGFWIGEERLKVIEGANDGANRVQLGTFRVR